MTESEWDGFTSHPPDVPSLEQAREHVRQMAQSYFEMYPDRPMILMGYSHHSGDIRTFLGAYNSDGPLDAFED